MTALPEPRRGELGLLSLDPLTFGTHGTYRRMRRRRGDTRFGFHSLTARVGGRGEIEDLAAIRRQEEAGLDRRIQ